MTRGRLILAALAAGALAAGTAAFAPAAAQAQRDWTRTVEATAEGGFRMGNPDAPVKLVEYVSLSCPHCRHFAEEGAPALIDGHVRGGAVSFEIRPFPLDPVASLAAQLNRCIAPEHAFAFNDAILASQGEWFARLDALTQAEADALLALEPGAMRFRVAALLGFDALAARHGLGPDRTRACLADGLAAARVEAIRAEAEAAGVHATPSFAINGRLVRGVHDWTSLSPLLAASAAR